MKGERQRKNRRIDLKGRGLGPAHGERERRKVQEKSNHSGDQVLGTPRLSTQQSIESHQKGIKYVRRYAPSSIKSSHGGEMG